MRGRIDLSGVELGKGKSRPLQTSGPFDFQIVYQKEKTTSKGDPMVSIKLVVVDNNDPEINGCHAWNNVVINEKAKGMFKHFLHVIGEPYENLVDYDSERWVGRKLRATGVVREFRGDLRFEIQSVDFYGGKEDYQQESLPEL